MRITSLLLCLLAALLLPSCITLSGQLTLPGGEASGGVGGSIGFSSTWPREKNKEPDPALPQDPSGKMPVPAFP